MLGFFNKKYKNVSIMYRIFIIYTHNNNKDNPNS